MPLVQSLARWESSIVPRYLKDSHLSTLTGTVVRLLEGAVSGQDYKATKHDNDLLKAADEEIQGDLEDIKLEMERLSKTLGATLQAIGELKSDGKRREATEILLEAEIRELNERVGAAEAAEASDPHEYVVNIVSQTCHRPGLGFAPTGTAEGWRARCGWAFGGHGGGYRFTHDCSEPGIAAWCNRCGFPKNFCPERR